MIPVTCVVNELNDQKKIVDQVYGEVCKKLGHSRAFRSCTGR